LSHKGQRTVYRLTIVKGYNEEEIDNYAKLVELGKPDFIEIKGVTYCGTSKGEEILLTIKSIQRWFNKISHCSFNVDDGQRPVARGNCRLCRATSDKTAPGYSVLV